MDLLIVDDEKITREGLISLIDWESLGIDNIYEASDGAEGLNLARKYHPSIVLTDMRMPRMDGPTMAARLRDMLPDCAVIFMSGYSDKEYMKAAITLKAVNYVEKPLDTENVAEAIKQAVEQLSENNLIKHGRSAQKMENKTRLAEFMTRPSSGKLPEDLILPDVMKPEDDFFTSVIIRFLNRPTTYMESYDRMAEETLSKILPKYKVNEIHAIKEATSLCIFLYGHRLSKNDINSLCNDIKRHLQDSSSYYIAYGDTYQGILHAWDSYSTAVIMLQESFFNDPGTILSRNDDTSASPSMVQDFNREFYDALITRNKNTCKDILSSVRSQFSPACKMFPSQVRDIYYRLFIQIQKAAEQSQISSGSPEGDRSIWSMLESADNVGNLHSSLEESVDKYFEMLSSRDTSSNIVFSIKEYIRQNYQNESLSIKSISDHVRRSAPYVCTFFKSETGTTLNQYITNYRIERAREILADPRSKITEVATHVGYNDVNYFGKIFKKITGMSPSEYRSSLSAIGSTSSEDSE